MRGEVEGVGTVHSGGKRVLGALIMLTCSSPP